MTDDGVAAQRLIDAARRVLERQNDPEQDPLLIAIERLLATADDEWFERFCEMTAVNDPVRFRASLREAVRRRQH